MGGGLNCAWRASRESHPSEDLSELPPLFETVAGQEYHGRLTGSLRNRLPSLLWTGWAPLCTLKLAVFDKSEQRKEVTSFDLWLLQVVLAHPSHRFPSSGPSANVFKSPDMTAETQCFSKSTKEKKTLSLTSPFSERVYNQKIRFSSVSPKGQGRF